MWPAIINWLTGSLVGQLANAYKVAKEAKTESERIAAEKVIKSIEATLEARKIAAGVVKDGMQHKVFWIPWLIAAVPTAAWFGWGMTDSLLNGALPDVAALPPQLKEYADIVFANIFYSGAAMGGVQVVASAIRGRR